MATQRMICANLIGESARRLTGTLESWTNLRQIARDSECDTSEWPASVRVALERLVESLRSHSDDMSIVYYAEWIDTWSMGGTIQQAIEWIGGNHQQYVDSPCFQLHFVSSTTFKTDNKATFRTQEECWLKQQLREAAKAGAAFAELQQLIVLIREPLGALRDDSEIIEAAEKLPSWLEVI